MAAVLIFHTSAALFPIHAQTLANPDIVQPGETFVCAPTTPGVEWYRTDRTFVIDPQNTQTMYLNVEWKGFYKSTDGGKTWSPLTKGIKNYGTTGDPNTPCGSEAPVALVDPTNSNRVIYGRSGSPGTLLDFNSLANGIFESLDGGASFHQLEQTWMNSYNTSAVVFQPDNPQVIYYGTTSQPPTYTGAPQTSYLTKGLVYQTLDDGRNWTELPTGFGTNTSATGIHIDPANPNSILVATFSKSGIAASLGLLRSLDRGNTWQRVTSLPAAYGDIIESSVAALNFKHIFLATQSDAPNPPRSYYSTDGGVTFQPCSMYLDLGFYDPLDSAGNHMLGYAWESTTGAAQKVVWESNDAGATWHALGNLPAEIVNIADPSTRVSNIVFDPKDRSKVYMTGASGYVWRSTDAGKTWTSIVDYTKLPNYVFPRTTPIPVISGVANAADYSANISPNTFMAISGQNLALTSRTWSAGDFQGNSLPIMVDGVQAYFYPANLSQGVTTANYSNGTPGYVQYVSANQVNVLVPASLSGANGGGYVVQVYTAGVPSEVFPFKVRFSTPAPFTYGAETGHNYAVATHADYSLIGPPSVYPGLTPARGGETIIIWANGLGATSPAIPDGQLPAGARQVAATVDVAFGNTPATAYAALVGAGLYQINVTVPPGLAAGDIPIQIRTSQGGTSDGKATIAAVP